MKKLALFAFAIAIACNSPSKEQKTYTFKAVGWTMTLPAEFEVVDSATSRERAEKGVATMEKTTGSKFDVSGEHILITARKGLSYFTSTIAAWDPQKDGDFGSAIQSVKQILYRTIVARMPSATLVSTSDTIKVGGLDFDRYRLTTILKKKPISSIIMLSKLYKGYDFSIIYIYTDDPTKTQIESILGSSKFQ